MLAGRAALWLPLVSSLAVSVTNKEIPTTHVSYQGPLVPSPRRLSCFISKRVTTNTRSPRTSSRHYRTLLSLLGPTPNILLVASSTSTYIGRRASH